jgi:hypothetical protein
MHAGGRAAAPRTALRGRPACPRPPAHVAPARRAAAAAPSQQEQQQQQPAGEAPPRILLPGLDTEIALTREPSGPGFIPDAMAAAPWVRPPERTFTGPSIRASGTLRPGPEWFPAWMKYRRREDNYVFWQDKFLRCSLDIPGARGGAPRRRRPLLRARRRLARPPRRATLATPAPAPPPPTRAPDPNPVSPPRPPAAQLRRSAGRCSPACGSW